MDQEKFWKVGGNDSNLDFSRRWKLSSSVNKRTVNRWHLGNFCSILAWKYIFSLSFLFPHSFASSFLCKFRAKISLQDRSWAMKMMKLDWPSCLSLSLSLSPLSPLVRTDEREARTRLSSIFRIDFSPPSMELRIYCSCHRYNSFCPFNASRLLYSYYSYYRHSFFLLFRYQFIE